MQILKLSKNKTCIVDDEDYQRLAKFKWCLTGKGYIKSQIKGETILLHRFIMGASIGDNKEIDHINRNKLDNRKANLRFCTHSENMLNRAPWDGSGSGSVYWETGRRKWNACFQRNKKRTRLGRFETREQAVAALLEAM